MAALFSGAALMNAAMAIASAVGTIVAGDHLGARWGAVPNTAGIVGTGTGALVLTWMMGRRGRRAGLTFGYLAAALGGAVAAGAVAAGNVLALSAGLLLLGLGNAGAQLSRYAAAELYPQDRRGFAISMVVWAGAVGAVIGPLLIGPAGALASSLGRTALTGPYAVAAAATLIAAGVARLALAGRGGRAAYGAESVRLRELARDSGARTALAVMVTAQVVMVAVMTATPLEMHMHGEGLDAVGLALSAHTLGMFALSPVTGRLIDRTGPRPVMGGGLGVLVLASVLAATTSGGGAPLRAGALFLLGYGWNLCFVGGSGRLARDLPEPARAGVEGAVDATVWGVAALASLVSTPVLSAGGYAALAWAAAACALAPTAFLLTAETR
ncbi:MFS transporter [Actinoallomurus oryzae]|uniref:MFS transporter n=2 Tax=Actinoallomurus oryzae TaxID=502180 RepID=A0ABP8PE14_9ACTN